MAKAASVFFFDAIPDSELKYADAFTEIVELEVSLIIFFGFRSYELTVELIFR